MGHMWPIRGEGFSLGGGAMGSMAPLVAGHPSPLFLVGIVAHGKGREGAPPLALYKVEEGSPFPHNTISLRFLSLFSFLCRVPLVWSLH